MTELTAEVRAQIIKGKITFYEQKAYDIGLDAEVAKDLDDDAMYQNAATNLKRIKQAQDVLRRKLAAVEAETGDEGALG